MRSVSHPFAIDIYKENEVPTYNRGADIYSDYIYIVKSQEEERMLFILFSVSQRLIILLIVSAWRLKFLLARELCPIKDILVKDFLV